MISVIVPFFNAEKYLGITLESLAIQSYTDFEVLMIDDGSKDRSQDIAKSYAQQDKRFRLICKKNGGVSTARNVGLDYAVGDYAFFMDADDCLYRDSLQILLSGFQNGVDLVIGGYDVFNDVGEKTYSIEERSKNKISKSDGIIQMYCPRPYRYQGYIWNKLFKLQTIRNHHLRFNESIYFNEDRLFITEYISFQNGNIFIDTTPVYKYYERSTGAMASISTRFNPKFVTDFHSMIQMKRIVKNAFNSPYLNELAMNGIVNSYRWIHNMMRDYNEFDVKLHRRMKLKLLFALNPKYMLKKGYLHK